MPVNYETLANYYNAGQLIPIIGAELLKIKCGIDENSNDRYLTFEEYLIEKKSKLKYGDASCPKTISELAIKFPELNSSDIIYHYNVIPSADFDLRLLQKLVDLPNFDFFVSTCYDRKLEDLIKSAGQQAESIYWNTEKKDTLLIDFGKDARKVVHLFGGITGNKSYEEISFHDEDKMECLVTLSLAHSKSPSTINEAFSFLDYLRGKILLFIGNNFQDFFMRFMVRTLHNSPYKKGLNKIYIINDIDAKLGFEEYIFKKYDIQIIHDSPIADVINNLYDTIKGEKFVEKHKQTVFISYDSEDRKFAKQLEIDLKRRGIKTWLDSTDLDIKRHQIEIRNVIGRPDTTVFISLLSKNIFSKSYEKSYVRSVEWKIAESKFNLTQSQHGTATQMKPFDNIAVAIDDFKRYHKDLPEFIREIAIKPYDHPDLIDMIEAVLINQKL